MALLGFGASDTFLLALGDRIQSRMESMDMDHMMVHNAVYIHPHISRYGAVQISVSEAKGQLTELVRRAEAGDEVLLTRHGKVIVRLAPVRPLPNADARRAVIAAVRASTADMRTRGASAARSQDFLYGDDGLPK